MIQKPYSTFEKKGNMSQIKCFWLEPTGTVNKGLRRYRVGHGNCIGKFNFHNAECTIEKNASIASCPRVTEDGYPITGDFWDHEDVRWPTKCDYCEYFFGISDAWQFFINRVYRRTDTGEFTTLENAPVGAMWNSSYGGTERRGADGISLMLKTPGGDWWVDGPSILEGVVKNNAAWTRTGVVPDVTAMPSIHIPGSYHGWLRDGYLNKC